MVPGETDFQKDGIPRAFDCNLDAPTYFFIRGDEKHPQKDRPLEAGLPEVLSFARLRIRPVPLPPTAHTPGLRPFVLASHLRAAELRIAAARENLRKARKAPAAVANPLKAEQARLAVVLAEKALAAAEAQPAALKARAAADRARGKVPGADARELARQAARAERQAALAATEESVARAELELSRAGAARKPAEQKLASARAALAAARKALAAPGEAYTPLPGAVKTPESNVEAPASLARPFPTTSSGRRSALAAWLTDRRNPLTARVAVNHVWARHFGRPLVETVFDFGRKGSAPSHPALLDWLAVELMESGWSLKHLHRLIVTSAAYRMTSSSVGTTRANRSADPENRFYWRMNPVRMEAQVIRDSLLHLAGDLDRALGGPSLPVSGPSRRRSLYFVHSHNEQQKFLATFDDASVLECYRRAESIVPQQALALSNSALALSAAEGIARRLGASPANATDEAFIQAAFATVLGSLPNPSEQAECSQALRQLNALAGGKGPAAVLRARANLVHALLNHNDFITIR
jgi:hypothetical protein